MSSQNQSPADMTPTTGAGQVLRRKAEEIAGENPATSLDRMALLSPEDMRRMLHELRVHQIQLEMQNEELRRAQVALDTERARYFDLYDLAPVGYCTLSEKGLILQVNLSAAVLLGVARGALVKQAVSRFILNEDQDIYYRQRKQLLETGEPQSCELRMLRSDGTSFWVHLAATAAQDEGGAPVHRLVLNDVNDLRQAQAALQKSETRYRTLVEWSPEAVAVHQDGKLLYANPAAIKLLGERSAQDLVGKPLLDFFHPDFHHLALARVNGTIEQGDGGPLVKVKLLRLDGMIVDAQVQSTSIVYDEKPAMHVAFRDITALSKAQEMLHLSDVALKAVSQGVVITGSDGRIIWANDAFSSITGFSAQEIMGRTCRFLQGPLTDQQATNAIRLAVENASEFSGELLNYRKDYTVFWNELTLSPARDEQGRLTHFIGVIRDITERRNTHGQIMAGQELLREAALHNLTILDNMMDGVITINAQGVMESFNKAACNMFGYAPHEALGRNVAMLMPEPHRSQHDGYLQHFQRTGEARVIGKMCEVEGRRQNGSVFPMSLSVTRIARAGQVIFIGITRDITQQRQDMERIRHLAFYDPLTGLPNRRLLMDRIKQGMLTSQRSGQHGAVMFLDLDHFKQLNDSLGHHVGDVLLQQVAARLKTCVREGDSVARLGGDEFVILLEALSVDTHEAAAQTQAIASKIVEVLGQAYNLLGHTYSCTPSIGIAVFMEEHETMDELLKNADVAMYQAKSSGRNTICFYDPAMHAPGAAQGEREKTMHRNPAPPQVRADSVARSSA